MWRSARRIVGGRPRFIVSLGVGAAAFGALPSDLATHTRLILAWDVGAVAFLTLVAVMFGAEHRARMQDDAARQQEGEWTIFFLTLAAIVASFASILSEFSDTKDLTASVKDLHVALVAATLLLSWLVTQTVFGLRYAHEYYTTSPGQTEIDGGLLFPEEPRPDYLDFMYFALVLGMTFQVSDVQITSRKLRRLASLHGFLGFVFNTIIIALTVNIASGLV